MPKSSEIESISQNFPARSERKLDGLGRPTTLSWTSRKFNFPDVLEPRLEPVPQRNGGSFDCSLKSQDFARGAQGELDNQESLKQIPMPVGWKSVTTQSPLVEQPLHQRTEAGAEKGLKEPLKRHVENAALIAFRNTKAVIAVDVSGSTRGKVIEHEIKAAHSICTNLSEAAMAQTTIIPWDHRLHGFTTVGDAERLRSEGGGTKPSALTSSLTSVRALRNCSAWMLFTDGKIVDREIRDFSRGLCTNGLHGTTCIIVLFGRRCQKPVDCNISVGISIFGMVPDCLFLFHDVDSGTVSMLQSKGVFNKLLPEGYGMLSLDDHSEWCELPTLNYSDLSRVDIPAPRKLEPGDILLQSNRAVRLNDIYNDTVDTVTANELLEVEDNLKTLLLTSEINGQRDRVKTWIANQKMKSRDMLHIPRPDISNAASSYIRELLFLGTSAKDLDQKISLQTKLRIAHKQNWVAFNSDIDAERTRVSGRAAVVHNALDRVTSNAVESSQSSWSARMLAPISPGGTKKSFGGPTTGSTSPPAPSPLAKSQVLAKEPYQPMSSSKPPRNPLSQSFQSYASRPKDSSRNGGDSPASLSLKADILFIQGYKHNRGSKSMFAFEGECPLCGNLQAILALLVKEPVAGLVSPGFPEPNIGAILEFPLAIGSYPQAKILSSFVCCDACAYHLVKMKKSPYGEGILGAIPLIHEALTGEFQETTLDILGNALSKKFETPALEQIFLSILYSTLMNLKEDCEDVAKKALHWAASLLATSISVPSTLSTTLVTGQLYERGNIPLRQALSNSLDTLSRPSPPLLQYPLGGIAVLTQCMIDLNLDPSTVLLKKAVFQRIIYRITENYHNSVLKNGREPTIKCFRSLVWSPDAQSEAEAAQTPRSPFSDETFDIISTPHLSVSISSLVANHILSAEDVESLQKLGVLFTQVDDTCSSALAVFLHILCKEQAWVNSTPMQMFDSIRAQEDFHPLFETPQSIGEAEAKKLIGLICFGTLGASNSEIFHRPLSGGVASNGLDDAESMDFDMLSEESYGGISERRAEFVFLDQLKVDEEVSADFSSPSLLTQGPKSVPREPKQDPPPPPPPKLHRVIPRQILLTT
ncbi:hypothetical protein N431DRAFT_552080 [Stipitochalara longipes BDJ]|nr:hypothetical protein N431DRAFT_552080 [Stipitochalara longipes BDJ]